MRAFITSLGMGLLTSALCMATGCGQDEDTIDLSDVPIASDEKADVYVPGSGYTWVRPSGGTIACIRPPCPKATIDDVNQGKTELAYAFDWRTLKLGAAEQANLEAKVGTMLLYGKYATAKMRGEPVQIYQVTRANPRVSEQSQDKPDSDRYYMVKQTDPACSQPPCGYTALLMNQPVKEQWTDMDLARLGLPQNALQVLVSELKKGSAYVSIQKPSVMPVVVTEAFRPHNATTLPNN